MRPPQLNDWMEWRELRARNEQYLRPFEPEWDDDWRAHDYFLHRLLMYPTRLSFQDCHRECNLYLKLRYQFLHLSFQLL